MKDFIDENTMMRLADNGSNVDVLTEIFKGLIMYFGYEEMLFICYPKC